MLSDIRRLLGSISIDERNGEIAVRGVPAKIMAGDIQRLWKTSRINTYLFSDLGRSHFTFPKFFTVDVVFAFNRLAQESRSLTARAAAKRIVAGIEQITWLSTVKDERPDILDLSKLKVFEKRLMDHQNAFLAQYNDIVPRYELNGYMLAAPPGAGKTLTGLALHECLGNDVLVAVVPKNSVEKVWVTALSEEYRRPQTSYWDSIAGKLPEEDKAFYICHYEALDRLLDIVPSLRRKQVTVILDESHNMNEITSQRTENFVEFCRSVGTQHVLWSSGTPLKAMGSEMIPFLRTTDRFFTSNVEDRFKRIFGMSVARANDILANRLGIVSYRVPKRDVVKGEPVEQTIKVQIPNGHRYTLSAVQADMAEFIRERLQHYKDTFPEHEAVYNQCIDIVKETLVTEAELAAFAEYQRNVRLLRGTRDYRQVADEMMAANQYELKTIVPMLPSDLKGPFKSSRSVIKYVSLKVKGEALGTILGRARINCHLDMVEYCDLPGLVTAAEKKTLIFTSYVEVVKKVERHMSERGFQPLAVYGETNKDLRQIVDRFDGEKAADPLVATYASLSTAVPLVMANVCIMLNQPFRTHEREQAVSRIDRLGQDTQVFFFSMLLDTGEEPNVSTRSSDIMEWSKQQVEEMMGVMGEVSLESYGQLPDPELSLLAYLDAYDRFMAPAKPSTVLSW
jgi:hypothetical protein